MIRSDRMNNHRDSIINKYLRCPWLKRFCAKDVRIKKHKNSPT